MSGMMTVLFILILGYLSIFVPVNVRVSRSYKNRDYPLHAGKFRSVVLVSLEVEDFFIYV